MSLCAPNGAEKNFHVHLFQDATWFDILFLIK